MSLFFEETLGLVYYITKAGILWLTDQEMATGIIYTYQCAGTIIISYDYRADVVYCTSELIETGKLGSIYNAKSAYENVFNYSFNNLGYTFCRIFEQKDALISNCGNIFMVKDLINSYYAINVAGGSINVVNKWFYKTNEMPTKIARLENESDINAYFQNKGECIYKIDTWRHFPIELSGEFYRIEFTEQGGLELVCRPKLGN